MTRRDLFRRVLGALAAPLVPAPAQTPMRLSAPAKALVYGTSNIYIPSTEGGKLIISYARDHARYRINKYVTVKEVSA